MKTATRLLVAATLVAAIAACSGPGENNGTTNNTTTNSATNSSNNVTNSSNVVTNGCGTYDLTGPTDSYVPDDPDDPEIVAACTAWCDEVMVIENCAENDRDTCMDECQQSSCTVCPGTLAPFVQCQADNFATNPCACGIDREDCPVATDCEDERIATGSCGG